MTPYTRESNFITGWLAYPECPERPERPERQESPVKTASVTGYVPSYNHNYTGNNKREELKLFFKELFKKDTWTDKDNWKDGWALVNNGAGRVMSTLATIPTLGFSNPLSSWIDNNRMSYTDPSIDGSWMDTYEDALGTGVGILLPAGASKILGASTSAAKATAGNSMPTTIFSKGISKADRAKLIASKAIPAAAMTTATPEMSSSISDIIDPTNSEEYRNALSLMEAERAASKAQDVQGVQESYEDRMANLDKELAGLEQDIKQLEEPVSKEQPKEIIENSNNSDNLYNSKPNTTPIESAQEQRSDLKSILNRNKYMALGGLIGTAGGGLLGHFLSRKNKSRSARIRNTALSMLAGGLLGGMTGHYMERFKDRV